MEPRLGGLLRLSSKKVHDLVLSRLHRAGFVDVTRSAYPLFYYPPARGARPAELTEKMGVSKQALNNILGVMETAGYIERRKDPGGGGRRLVWLTERGEELSRFLLAITLEVEEELLREIGRNDYETLNRVLHFLADEFTFDPH